MLHSDLKNDLALVTGATGGIGKATCKSLAALGCSIAVHYNSAADVAKTLVAQLEELGVKSQAFQANLSNYDEVGMGRGEGLSKRKKELDEWLLTLSL